MSTEGFLTANAIVKRLFWILDLTCSLEEPYHGSMAIIVTLQMVRLKHREG